MLLYISVYYEFIKRAILPVLHFCAKRSNFPCRKLAKSAKCAIHVKPFIKLPNLKEENITLFEVLIYLR